MNGKTITVAEGGAKRQSRLIFLIKEATRYVGIYAEDKNSSANLKNRERYFACKTFLSNKMYNFV
jgi:hypothetical protein